MKPEEEVKKMLAEVEADERLYYPAANVEINAPLALIQVDLAARRHILRWVLEQIGKRSAPAMNQATPEQHDENEKEND